MKTLTRKMLASMLLAAFVNLSYIPAFSADMGLNQQVLNKDGNYGANLNSITGATVNSNGTYADITNTHTNSTLYWNSLNTAPGQTLNYNLTDVQTSLNKVLGTAPSTFAGNLTSTGGRVIIANPCGIIFENGSYTNVNSLILTTHDVIFENGDYKFDGIGSVNSQGIQIGGIGNSQNAAVMRIADDLNIISNGIKIKNADILAGNNVRLITADGVNFVATETPVVTDTKNINAIAFEPSISLKDSAIAVKNEDGRIYLIAKGDSTKANIEALNSALVGKTKLDIDGNAVFEVIGNLDIVDSIVKGNLIAKTIKGSLNLTNSKIDNLISSSSKTLEEHMIAEGKSPYAYKWEWKWDNTWDSIWGKKTTRPSTPTEAGLIANSNKYGQWESVLDSDKVVNNIKNFLDVSTDDAKEILAYHLNDTYSSVTKTFDVNTSTTASGQGSISIANTTINGDLTVTGAGINFDKVVANNVNADSIIGTAVAYNSDADTITDYTAISDSKWSPEGNEIKINNKWVTAKYHKTKLFDGKIGPYWTYNNDERWVWFSDVTSRYGKFNSNSTNKTTVATNALNSGYTVNPVNKLAGNITAKNSKFTKIKAAAADITFDNTNVTTGSDSIEATKSITIKNKSDVSDAVLNAKNGTITATGMKINSSKLNARTINAGKTTINNSTLKASNKINLNGDSSYTGKGATLTDSTVTLEGATGDKEIVILSNAKLINSNVKSSTRIDSGNVTLDNSTLTTTSGDITLSSNASDGIKTYITNNIIRGNSSITAENGNINILKTTGNISSLNLKAGNGSVSILDSSLSGNIIANTNNLKIKNNSSDINVADSTIANSINISDTKNLNITNTKANSITTTNTGNVSLKKVNLTNDLNIANAGKISIANSTLNNVIANSSKNITVSSSTKANSLDLSTSGDVIVSTIAKVTGLLKANCNNITISGTTDSIGSLDLVSLGNIKVSSSTIKNNTKLLSGKDVSIENKAKLNGETTVKALGDITIKGVNINNNLTITGANNVKITSASITPDAATPTIEDLSKGKAQKTDYNAAKFIPTDFENLIEGNKFGVGERISYIAGNVDISNVSNIDIINTAITGDLTETNYSGNANLITSYVGGTYIPDRTVEGNETSVYQSYIEEYVPYYMTDEFNYENDNDRKNFGDELDTVFRRQFNPKGFAAADDEIMTRMNATKASARSGRNNSIILTRKFIAD